MDVVHLFRIFSESLVNDGDEGNGRLKIMSVRMPTRTHIVVHTHQDDDGSAGSTRVAVYQSGGHFLFCSSTGSRFQSGGQLLLCSSAGSRFQSGGHFLRSASAGAGAGAASRFQSGGPRRSTSARFQSGGPRRSTFSVRFQSGGPRRATSSMAIGAGAGTGAGAPATAGASASPRRATTRVTARIYCGLSTCVGSMYPRDGEYMRANDKRLERTNDGERSVDLQIFMSQRSDKESTGVQAGGRKGVDSREEGRGRMEGRAV